MKRAIQRLLQDPLAQAFLAGEFRAGDKIEADVVDDKIVFAKLGVAEPRPEIKAS